MSKRHSDYEGSQKRIKCEQPDPRVETSFYEWEEDSDVEVEGVEPNDDYVEGVNPPIDGNRNFDFRNSNQSRLSEVQTGSGPQESSTDIPDVPLIEFEGMKFLNNQLSKLKFLLF